VPLAYNETLYCINSIVQVSRTLSESPNPCCFVLCTLSNPINCGNLILLMENSRIIYETLIKSRCSDSHWSKVKSLANTCGIILDRQGLNLIINLRKLNPRYFNLYPQIQPCLIRLGESISGSIVRGAIGLEIVQIIKSDLKINPDQSTITRWFSRAGLKFRHNDFYDKQSCMIVLTNALIFKAKQARLKGAK
jgi:hypothetical protein